MKMIDQNAGCNYERLRNQYYGFTDTQFSDLPGYDPDKCVWLYCDGDCERCELNDAESL